MKKNRLRLITVLTLMVSFLFTGGIFAYWASGVAGDEEQENPQITIGVGQSLETTLSLAEVQSTAGVLVPAGFESAGHVSAIVKVYEVTLLPSQDGANGAIATLTVQSGTLPNPLLVVTITQNSSTIVAGGALVQVTVTITLTEPSTPQEYNQVAGMNFDIPLTFTASI